MTRFINLGYREEQLSTGSNDIYGASFQLNEMEFPHDSAKKRDNEGELNRFQSFKFNYQLWLL